MSLFGSRVGLTSECDLERNTPTSDGAGGMGDSWVVLASDVRCLSWADPPQSAVVADQVVEIEMRHVLVPAGTDVRPGDRVVAVTLRGETYMDGPMPVDSVVRHGEVLEIVSRKVT